MLVWKLKTEAGLLSSIDIVDLNPIPMKQDLTKFMQYNILVMTTWSAVSKLINDQACLLTKYTTKLASSTAIVFSYKSTQILTLNRYN